MKRSSYSATARTHWEELAAAALLRPISTYGCIPLAQAAAIRQVERASSAD